MTDNYGDLSEIYANFENSKIVILPVPFEKSTSYLKGTEHGPQAIIEASKNMELYDIETDSEVYLNGIYTHPPISHECSKAITNQLYSDVLSLLNQDKFVVTLGGEHTVSLGPIRAHADRFGPIGVLQLDAHTDLRPSYENNPFSHASVMARAKEHKNVQSISAVGIRSMCVEEKENLKNVHLFLSEDLQDDDLWIDKVIDSLPQQVYISIDLDVFDPSILPATGTPEPGGMKWYPILKLLKKVVNLKKVVGFDVVELRPIKEDPSSDFLAAKLIYKTLSYIFHQPTGEKNEYVQVHDQKL